MHVFQNRIIYKTRISTGRPFRSVNSFFIAIYIYINKHIFNFFSLVRARYTKTNDPCKDDRSSTNIYGNIIYHQPMLYFFKSLLEYQNPIRIQVIFDYFIHNFHIYIYIFINGPQPQVYFFGWAERIAASATFVSFLLLLLFSFSALDSPFCFLFVLGFELLESSISLKNHKIMN